MSKDFYNAIWMVGLEFGVEKQERMDPTRLKSVVQTGSGGVDQSVIFLPHFLLASIMYLRNNQSAHVLVTTSCRITHHTTKLISIWFLEHDNESTVLEWPPQSPDSNQREPL